MKDRRRITIEKPEDSKTGVGSQDPTRPEGVAGSGVWANRKASGK